MSSFELKPQQQLHIGIDVESLTWTVPRDVVPVLLEGRISLSTWQDTFDKVLERYRAVLGAFSSWMLIPCFICCSMPRMIAITQENERAWLTLVQEQAQVYRPAGIQVTLAKEIHTMGAGSSRNVRNETVGLRFEIGPVSNQTNAAANFKGGISTAGNDLANELTQLAKLHKDGALTDEEYSQAKSKLLRK